MSDKIALIEAGGTKFIVGVGDASRNIHARTRIDTTRPDETIPAAVEWLRAQGGDYAAVGIASFGPLDLDPASPKWGHITRTTKPHWSDADIAGPFARAFGCPVAIDTDVNGAALAEWKWGAGQGTSSTLYLTVGTGVGGGAVVGGRPIHGLSHPEMGHSHSFADVGIDSANSQAQFKSNFFGSLQSIDMTKAFPLPRGQTLTESVCQFGRINGGQNRAACHSIEASPLRSPKQHLLLVDGALAPLNCGKEFLATAVSRNSSRVPINRLNTRATRLEFSASYGINWIFQVYALIGM